MTPSGAMQPLEARVVPPGWRAVAGVAAAALLVLGVGLLIARVAGFSEVRDEIQSADSSWFLLCLAAELLVLAAYASVIRGASTPVTSRANLRTSRLSSRWDSRVVSSPAAASAPTASIRWR